MVSQTRATAACLGYERTTCGPNWRFLMGKLTILDVNAVKLYPVYECKWKKISENSRSSQVKPKLQLGVRDGWWPMNKLS